MTKLRLVILRHAKSSWSSDAPNDHERPLNKRGKRDAPRMGRYLAEHDWLPERVISSDSQRTRETVARLFEPIAFEPRIRFTRDLYHAGLDELRSAIDDFGADEESLLLVGHNPGWEAAVETLSGEEHRFTTCNAAVFEAAADSWSAAFEDGAWELVELARPKELPAEYRQ